MIKSMIILLSLLLLMGCCEQQPPIPDPPDDPKDTIFELIWQSPIDTIEGTMSQSEKQIWNNLFLTTGPIEIVPIIYAFNTKTGKEEWEYINAGGLKYKIIYNRIINDIYIGITNDGVFGFDLHERKMKWQINQKQLNISFGWGMTVRGDYIYQPVTWSFGMVNIAVEKMLRIHYLTGEYETIYQTARKDGIMDAFSSPVFWTDPVTRHDIMYFNNQNWNYETAADKVTQDMIAVDVVTKEVVWKNSKFSPNASNGSIPPAIYKDNIITGGDWSIYSFDARTGKQNWKWEFLEQKPFGIWNTAQHLVQENRLYVNPGSEDVICLNAETGALIWKNPKGGPNCTKNMTYYKDMLVFTSWGYGSIMVLDAFTGKKIHQEYPHNNSNFYTDVIYDPTTDMFFTTDFLYAYGFKIRKPK